MEKRGADDFLVEQYKQAHEADRHYDQMAWTMGTVLMPVALGVLAITVNAIRYLSFWEVIILGFVSVSILCAWRIMFAEMGYWQDLRSRPLIKNIESHFNAEPFFREKAPSIRKLSRPGGWVGVRVALWFIIIVFAIAWGWLAYLKWIN